MRAGYRTTLYGVEGTGMARWDGLITPEDTWTLARYVLSIQRERTER